MRRNTGWMLLCTAAFLLMWTNKASAQVIYNNNVTVYPPATYSTGYYVPGYVYGPRVGYYGARRYGYAYSRASVANRAYFGATRTGYGGTYRTGYGVRRGFRR